MPRQPAFLFYSSDFLTGVQDLTMEERGQFITLLCLQHQKGKLSPKILKMQGHLSADVMSRFEVDDEGNYYNERLKKEVEKSQKRRKSGKKGASIRWQNDSKPDSKQYSKRYGKHYSKAIDKETMTIDNEDVIDNVIDYLNANADKNYSASAKSHRKYINARIKDGATMDDFILVMQYKIAEWISTDMNKYLRPSTLFNSDKFQTYLDESREKQRKGISPSDYHQQVTPKQSGSRLNELRKAVQSRSVG